MQCKRFFVLGQRFLFEFFNGTSNAHFSKHLLPLFSRLKLFEKLHCHSYLFLVPVRNGNKPTPEFISIARVLFITIYLFLHVGELSHKSTLGTGMLHPLTVVSPNRRCPNATDKNQSIRSRKTSHRILNISRNWCYTAETERDHAVCSILCDFLICSFHFRFMMVISKYFSFVVEHLGSSVWLEYMIFFILRNNS